MQCACAYLCVKKKATLLPLRKWGGWLQLTEVLKSWEQSQLANLGRCWLSLAEKEFNNPKIALLPFLKIGSNNSDSPTWGYVKRLLEKGTREYRAYSTWGNSRFRYICYCSSCFRGMSSDNFVIIWLLIYFSWIQSWKFFLSWIFFCQYRPKLVGWLVTRCIFPY